MSNLMKVGMTLLIVGVLLVFAVGVFELQNAAVRVEAERLQHSIPAPHHRGEFLLLTSAAMLCSVLGLAMARSAVK